jgi:hypothetical protein
VVSELLLVFFLFAAYCTAESSNRKTRAALSSLDFGKSGLSMLFPAVLLVVILSLRIPHVITGQLRFSFFQTYARAVLRVWLPVGPTRVLEISRIPDLGVGAGAVFAVLR